MKKVNLLNIKTLLLILIFGSVSCSNDDTGNNFDANAKYTHPIANCDNTNNPEVNCTEFVEFSDSGIVNVLIGGGDITFQTEYDINESEIAFKQSAGLNYNITFTIIDDNTLRRIEDGEIWVKE